MHKGSTDWGKYHKVGRGMCRQDPGFLGNKDRDWYDPNTFCSCLKLANSKVIIITVKIVIIISKTITRNSD